MLEFYTASNLNSLYDQYSEGDGGYPTNPLQPKRVVVPSMSVGRWLTMRLAEGRGVCANFERVLPASLAWQLYRQLNPSLPDVSDFDQPVMLYRILGLLSDESFCDDFPRLSRYVGACEPRDLLALAQKLVRIFDHYQHYRADWLAAWADGNHLGLAEDEPWQQAMWQRLSNSSEQLSRGQLQQGLIAAITQGELTLPERIDVFGVSSLAPHFIELLQALAARVSVRVFALSHAAGALPHWCLPGSELIQLLGKPKPVGVEPAPSSRLEVLQQALAAGSAGLPKPPEDDSITLVSCFSPMRELEALHDYLLNAFTQDATTQSTALEPGQVLVVMPNIDEYAPFIRAVFNSTDDNTIPFTISANLAATESTLIEGLQTLLQLSKWRFTREEVLTLLRNRLVQQKYQITDRDFEQLNAWLETANVRWGIDAQHRAELGLPATDDNTWRQGLDRLLLGFAMPHRMANQAPLYEGLLPVDDIDSSGSVLLSQLVQYCECLFAWRQRLQIPQNIQQWQATIQALVSDFFVVDGYLQGEYVALLKTLDTHALAMQQSQASPLLDGDAMSLLLAEMAQTGPTAGRLSGSVTFAGMSDLQGIPYRQVCILGMNYDAWPSNNREPGFDLLHGDKRLGDRDRPADERYTTLQLIQAASQRVYISYVGRNIASADEIPPSVLVAELTNLAEKLGMPLTPHCHAIHPFSPDNFNAHTPWQSHSKQWLAVAQQTGQGTQVRQALFAQEPAAAQTASEITELEVDDLLSFYRNPQRHFLRNQLGVYLQEQGLDWQNDEPFDLSDNFADGNIRQQMLQHYLKGFSDESDALLLADGVMPAGELGAILLQQQRQKVDELTAGINSAWVDDSLPPVPIALNIGGVQVNGSLSDLKPCGQVKLQATHYYDYQRVDTWLRHLLLCAAQPDGVALHSTVLAMDKTVHYPPQQEAVQLLQPWIEAYRQSQQQPLPFFAKSSSAYAASFTKGKHANNPDKALKKAEEKWRTQYQSVGDDKKPENVYLYRHCPPLDESFARVADALLSPAIAAEDNQ
jgi:exodeoxyribonuclease V gamma subunit